MHLIQINQQKKFQIFIYILIYDHLVMDHVLG